jgi:hypothetical protein
MKILEGRVKICRFLGSLAGRGVLGLIVCSKFFFFNVFYMFFRGGEEIGQGKGEGERRRMFKECRYFLENFMEEKVVYEM